MHSPDYDELCLLSTSGELPESERARFEAHRPGCADCAQLLAAIAAGSRLAERAGRSLPAGRLEGLLERAAPKVTLPGDSARSAAYPGLRRWLGGLALAGAGLAVYFALLPPGREVRWSNGIEGEVARLDRELKTLDTELALGGEDVFELELEGLEESVNGLERQLTGGRS